MAPEKIFLIPSHIFLKSPVNNPLKTCIKPFMTCKPPFITPWIFCQIDTIINLTSGKTNLTTASIPLKIFFAACSSCCQSGPVKNFFIAPNPSLTKVVTDRCANESCCFNVLNQLMMLFASPLLNPSF